MLVMVAFTTSAGTWKRHNIYVSSYVYNVFDTGDKIYYLNGTNLFQFDKATSTTTALTKQNKLSDDNISQIYYDYET